MQPIVIVLPLREAVRSGAAGAVALTVAEFGHRSVLRDRLVVVGGTARGDYPMPHYRQIEDRGWWRGLPGSAWTRPSHRYADAAARLARENGAALVEVHNSARLFRRIAGRVPAGCPVTFQIHNDPHDMTGLRTAAERREVLSRAALVYCLSDYIRERFLHGLADAGERVVTLANGVDVSAAPCQADRLPGILFVGRLNAEKGLDVLIDALRRLAPRLPDWRVTVIGRLHERDRARYGGALGEMEAAWGGRLSIASGVPHQQVMQEFGRASITLVPSVWPEPFGRVALEAMAAGSAVIASRSGGLPEIVGDAGVLLDETTADALANAVHALANEPERCSRLGRAGRARAEQRFDIGLLSGRLDRYRTGLIDCGRATPDPQSHGEAGDEQQA